MDGIVFGSKNDESEPTIMKYDSKEFKKLPNIMNKEQLRRACHISKRTALYLLQSGLIPCETTGKKTRCYSIKKKDIIDFLKDREQNPSKYLAPENWYKGSSSPPKKKPYVVRYLPNNKATKRQMEDYYTEKLADYSDVIDVDSICKITGYNRRTVGVWCRAGKLKYIMSTPKYLIPKRFLIDFLISDTHNNTIRKSKKHLATIWEISDRSHNGFSLTNDVSCSKECVQNEKKYYK